MSLFCFCIAEKINKNSNALQYKQRIKTHAMRHELGISFSVDWFEPIMSPWGEKDLIINILDSISSSNCELFLLPDGWYYNGQTNKTTFRERMLFLQDICNIFINEKCTLHFYLAQSGTEPEELTDIIIKSNELVDYLTRTVGVHGIDNGVHITAIL